jgi:hypothetical protein
VSWTTARDELAVEGKQGAEEPVAAREVEADDAVTLAVEIDEDGGLAGTGHLAGAALGDVAVFDEFGDEVGDRDPGEARFARQVGPTHGTLVEEGLQHEGPVVLGEHLGGVAQRPARAERPTACPTPGRGGFRGAALHIRVDHVC